MSSFSTEKELPKEENNWLLWCPDSSTVILTILLGLGIIALVARKWGASSGGVSDEASNEPVEEVRRRTNVTYINSVEEEEEEEEEDKEEDNQAFHSDDLTADYEEQWRRINGGNNKSTPSALETSLIGRIKLARQKAINKKIQESLTENDMKMEKIMEGQQLCKIFSLLRDNEDKFGQMSIEDVKKQMSMYKGN